MDKKTKDKEVKFDLATAYQILGYLGLDDHTYTHLSARPKGEDYFYIYPFGLLFEEVTENNLLKVSCNGDVLEGEECQYNRTGYVIHGSIYQARPDVNAIFHIHTTASVAVSSMQCGLLPLSQWALHFYNRIAYHDYNSLALEDEHGNQLVNDMQDKFIVLMRNHGVIIAGRTVQEAMFYTHHLEKACQAQTLAMQSQQPLVVPPAAVCEKAVNDLLSFEKDLGQRDWLAWLSRIKRYKTFFQEFSS